MTDISGICMMTLASWIVPAHLGLLHVVQPVGHEAAGSGNLATSPAQW